MHFIAGDQWTWIHGYVPGVLDDAVSWKPHNFWFATAYKKGKWDGRKRLTEYDRRSCLYKFPSGLLPDVLQLLDDRNRIYTLEDKRTTEVTTPQYDLLPDIHLDQGKYAYQSCALDAALSAGRGILKLPTGAGKSEIGAAIFKSLNLPGIWLTHRTNLLYQTRARLSERLGLYVGILWDGQYDYQPITVAMVQTLDRRVHDSFLKTRKAVIADECHHLPADQWVDNMAAIPAPYRFGLSATPQESGEGIYLKAWTGPVLYEISVTDLIDRDVLVKPRIWFATVDKPKIPASSAWGTVYKEGVTNNPTRHALIRSILWQFRREERPAICLVARVGHGRTLTKYLERAGLPTKFIEGKVPQAEREEIFEDLRTGELACVVANAPCVGEGTDLPWLSAIVNATGLRGAGNRTDGDVGRDVIQFLGRGLRSSPGKTYMDYVDFSDTTHKYLAKASAERVKTLERQGYAAYIKYWSDYAEFAGDDLRSHVA